MSIELKLSRSNRIYRPSELLEGKIITNFPSPIYHQGIRLNATGTVNMQVRGGTAGVIDSFYGVVKPISIMNKSVEVRSSGKLGSGTNEIPFSMTLRQQGKDNSELFYETFHGANISIQYLITVDINRGYLHKSLSATMEFIIESEKGNLLEAPVSPEMVIFYITQDTQKHPLLPELRSGLFLPWQIADGDVCRNMTLPIYVILPRLLTCPTVYAGPFSIEFQVSIVINFQSDLSKLHPKSDPKTPRLWLAMETVPLKLVRTNRDRL
ncbi:vacuolar protein sorting-associated protein 26C-like isoform X3 [Macadamia integrifolia]|uniref:vacuolar protein sorting-associated protein 26C-like isoform X3 n=1 Tax=Macadamia integrifolia TaxID=60698 RepID=UPI001C4EC005|nr:vacuolar protein sorting-associated protein 26C-like isoform X3 [Macadamia integrifolia]